MLACLEKESVGIPECFFFTKLSCFGTKYLRSLACDADKPPKTKTCDFDRQLDVKDSQKMSNSTRLILFVLTHLAASTIGQLKEQYGKKSAYLRVRCLAGLCSIQLSSSFSIGLFY